MALGSGLVSFIEQDNTEHCSLTIALFARPPASCVLCDNVDCCVQLAPFPAHLSLLLKRAAV